MKATRKQLENATEWVAELAHEAGLLEPSEALELEPGRTTYREPWRLWGRHDNGKGGRFLPAFSPREIGRDSLTACDTLNAIGRVLQAVRERDREAGQ